MSPEDSCLTDSSASWPGWWGKESSAWPMLIKLLGLLCHKWRKAIRAKVYWWHRWHSKSTHLFWSKQGSILLKNSSKWFFQMLFWQLNDTCPKHSPGRSSGKNWCKWEKDSSQTPNGFFQLWIEKLPFKFLLQTD